MMLFVITNVNASFVRVNDTVMNNEVMQFLKLNNDQDTSCSKINNCINISEADMSRTVELNGCGPSYLPFDVVPDLDFEKCCNLHDFCYKKCDSNFTFGRCNDAFNSCMSNVCSTKSFFAKIFCNSVRYLYYKATETEAGCKAYRNHGDQCKCAVNHQL